MIGEMSVEYVLSTLPAGQRRADSQGVWSGFAAFDTPGLTLQQLETVARYYYGLGYGYFCPTMVTASPEACQANLPFSGSTRI